MGLYVMKCEIVYKALYAEKAICFSEHIFHWRLGQKYSLIVFYKRYCHEVRKLSLFLFWDTQVQFRITAPTTGLVTENWFQTTICLYIMKSTNFLWLDLEIPSFVIADKRPEKQKFNEDYFFCWSLLNQNKCIISICWY